MINIKGAFGDWKVPDDAPGIGFITPDLEIVSHPVGEYKKFHVSIGIFNLEELREWRYDDNLRFSLTHPGDEIILTGNPALKPFKKNHYEMLKTLCNHFIEKGLPGDINLKIKNHNLNVGMEGINIGTIEEYA